MTLAPVLRPAPQQRMGLAPAVRASLSVLRMPLADLHAEIAREAAENPFLRWRRSPLAAEPLAAAPVESLAAEPSLLDRLRAQIGLMPLEAGVRAMAEHLAGELRDDGYLDTPLEEIAAELDVPLALAEAGLSALQSCDPAGVGARDLAECLALQLADRGVPRALAAAAVARLEDFVAGNWRALGRALGCGQGELERIAGLLPGLVAHPVAAAPPAPPLMPDLVAEPGPGGPAVRLAREAAPRLVLDRAMLRRAAGEPFAEACRVRAEALIAAVAARGATLLRIGAHLAEVQQAAFAHGPEHLRPLTRVEVAAALGLHPSTVGRATAGKGIGIDGRVLPLERFFSAALPQTGGPALAGHAVRLRIARLVAEEPAGAPLSDEAIRQALAGEGIDIARRTVAKYREWMHLPSSHRRRRMWRRRGHGTGQGR